MPITFDSMKEFEAFCRAFQLVDGSKTATKAKPALKKAATEVEAEPPKKRGRKPGQTVKKSVKAAKVSKAKATKPPKAKSSKAQKPVKAVKTKAKAVKTPKAAKPKSARGGLTQLVLAAIESFITQKQPFVGQDILTEVQKQVPEVKATTVLSTASTLLSKKFGHLETTTRPGSGLRPLKVYLP